jgi:hypothetical protein
MKFVRLGLNRVVALDQIAVLDCQLEHYDVVVTLRSGEKVYLHGQAAFDLVMAVKPSAFEGKRVRYARHAWAFHNLVAHPLLQVLAWLGQTRLGFAIHDMTVPRPKNPDA